MLEYIKNGNIYNSSAGKIFPELEHFADFCILKYSEDAEKGFIFTVELKFLSPEIPVCTDSVRIFTGKLDDFLFKDRSGRRDYIWLAAQKTSSCDLCGIIVIFCCAEGFRKIITAAEELKGILPEQCCPEVKIRLFGLKPLHGREWLWEQFPTAAELLDYGFSGMETATNN